jgi:hypothetical protein
VGVVVSLGAGAAQPANPADMQSRMTPALMRLVSFIFIMFDVLTICPDNNDIAGDRGLQ